MRLPKELAAPLLIWYRENARDLPWRRDITPYRVWVSEIMLQQTRVEAVKPYFERFMRQLPDVKSLAEADVIFIKPPDPLVLGVDVRKLHWNAVRRISVIVWKWIWFLLMKVHVYSADYVLLLVHLIHYH